MAGGGAVACAPRRRRRRPHAPRASVHRHSPFAGPEPLVRAGHMFYRAEYTPPRGSAEEAGRPAPLVPRTGSDQWHGNRARASVRVCPPLARDVSARGTDVAGGHMASHRGVSVPAAGVIGTRRAPDSGGTLRRGAWFPCGVGARAAGVQAREPLDTDPAATHVPGASCAAVRGGSGSDGGGLTRHHSAPPSKQSWGDRCRY